MLRHSIAIMFLAPWFAATANAHFIWAEIVETAGQPPLVRLCFSESAVAGEPHLIGKIAQSQAWARSADGSSRPVTLKTQVDEQAGALVAPCPTPAPMSFEAVCDYGVTQRVPGGIRLHYFAKHLTPGWPGQKPESLRADALKLDISPSLAGGKLELLVRYEGQPDAGRDVVVHDPAGGEHSLRTDDRGRVSLDVLPGRYAIRASHVEPNRGGTLDGKSYAQTSSHATLTLAAPDPAPPGSAAPGPTAAAAGAAGAVNSAAGSGGEPSAEELLRRARQARAVWEDFPGYTADVTVNMGDRDTTGKVTVNSEGDVSLEMPEGPARKWVESLVASLVQHRMPDGEAETGKVTFADADTGHPLGRRIDLGDAHLSSVYRIRDNVIYEVNRNAGPIRFTISVLEVTWNRDHKYLPRAYVINSFDTATGALKLSVAHLDEWQRVGDFDLPTSILEIGAGEGSARAKRMTFANYRLTEKR